jgi:hypothetical protein
MSDGRQNQAGQGGEGRNSRVPFSPSAAASRRIYLSKFSEAAAEVRNLTPTADTPYPAMA